MGQENIPAVTVVGQEDVQYVKDMAISVMTQFQEVRQEERSDVADVTGLAAVEVAVEGVTIPVRLAVVQVEQNTSRTSANTRTPMYCPNRIERKPPLN